MGAFYFYTEISYNLNVLLLLFILKVLDVSENQVSKVIEAKEIMTLLPHRYPFLLVDRVLAVSYTHLRAHETDQ